MIRVFCRVLRGCLAFRLIVPHWILVLPLSSDMDLKSLIHDHSHFFDLLVDLIPARFYVPVPDNQERPWFHGLSKAAKASVKKESRENIKKARWARYNPENTSSTLDVLKKAIDDEKKSLAPSEEEKPCSDGDSGSDREAEVEDPHTVNSADCSVTYEELRNRLHRRIEELRGNRNTRTLDKPKNEKRDKRKKNFEVLCSRETDASQRKRKRDEDFGKEGNDDVRKKDGRAQAEDFSYGQVKLGGVEEGGKKMRKLSKQQELDKAKRLEDAKKDPEKGKIIADKHSWKAAMSRAIGGKVHDDPKVLQQSIKKEQKRHHKHAEKWKDRIESQNKAREEKQKTRTDNIRERIHQKKTRRIEKREKKLMRPGFEGRKDGYINE